MTAMTGIWSTGVCEHCFLLALLHPGMASYMGVPPVILSLLVMSLTAGQSLDGPACPPQCTPVRLVDAEESGQTENTFLVKKALHIMHSLLDHVSPCRRAESIHSRRLREQTSKWSASAYHTRWWRGGCLFLTIIQCYILAMLPHKVLKCQQDDLSWGMLSKINI